MLAWSSRGGALSLAISTLAMILFVAEAEPCAKDAGSACGGLRVWPRQLLAPSMPPLHDTPLPPVIELGDEYDPSGDKDEDLLPNDEAAVPKPPSPALYGASALTSITERNPSTTTRPIDSNPPLPPVNAGTAFGPVPEREQAEERSSGGRGLLRVVKKGATASNQPHS